MNESKTLLLFDQDNILWDVLIVHKSAFEHGFQQGYNTTCDFDFFKSRPHYVGSTTRTMLREYLLYRQLTREKIDSGLENCEQIMANHAAGELQKLTPKEAESHHLSEIRKDTNRIPVILPGLKHFLQKAKKMDDRYILATATGTSAPISKQILKWSGFERYFAVMAFGCEAETRKEIFGLAIERAKLKHDINKVVIFEDSIAGIKVAKELGAITIAVRTGPHADLLEAEKPDLIVDDLSDWKTIFEFIDTSGIPPHYLCGGFEKSISKRM